MMRFCFLQYLSDLAEDPTALAEPYGCEPPGSDISWVSALLL